MGAGIAVNLDGTFLCRQEPGRQRQNVGAARHAVWAPEIPWERPSLFGRLPARASLRPTERGTP